MLANVRHHEPGRLAAILAELFDELDVPPIHIRKAAGVVIAVAAQDWQAVVRARLGGQIVPLMASHLARLTANANRRVGVESNGFGHKASCRRTKLLTIRRRARMRRSTLRGRRFRSRSAPLSRRTV